MGKGSKRTYGIGVDKLIPTDMEAFRQKMAEHTEQEYPEMKREITVFILLNVDGKYEQQIFDKLLALSANNLNMKYPKRRLLPARIDKEKYLFPEK